MRIIAFPLAAFSFAIFTHFILTSPTVISPFNKYLTNSSSTNNVTVYAIAVSSAMLVKSPASSPSLTLTFGLFKAYALTSTMGLDPTNVSI